jgi:hypothetical protein
VQGDSLTFNDLNSNLQKIEDAKNPVILFLKDADGTEEIPD